MDKKIFAQAALRIIFQEATCTASGETAKFVECEQCKQRYVYRMDRQVEGRATGLLGIGVDEKARDQAEKELEQQLNADCDPVPCPQCGWYQTDMVDKLRRERHELIHGASFLLLIPCAALVPFAIAGYIYGPPPIYQMICVGISLAVMFGLLCSSNWLARGLQPNDAPQATRIQTSHGKAEKVDDFGVWLRGQGIVIQPEFEKK